MKRLFASIIGGIALAATATPAAAQGSCSREDLAETADNWVQAVKDGNPFPMRMGEWVDYWENFGLATLNGFFTHPREVDWTLQLLDTGSCMAFVEIVVNDPDDPIVLATQLTHFGFNGSVGKIDNITNQAGDWLFNPAATLEYAQSEDWSEIPEGRRNTRAELIAAADAYLDKFLDNSVEVPWGMPCRRLEGGLYTGRGEPTDSCDVGVPEGIELVDRRYVVDETLGAVSVFLSFGGLDGLPDSHMFRVVDGKIVNIHTVTNCKGVDNCGFPPFDGAPPQ
jgi:hypothetical protein